MTDPRRIAQVPGVTGVVVGDLGGVLLDAVGDPDPEAAAAVAGFLASHLVELGARLGLGPLQRVAVVGAGRGALLLLRDGGLLAARFQPAGALGAVERALDTPGAGR